MRTSRLEAFSDGVLAAASTSKRRWGRDLKGKLSPALYLIGIEVSFVEPWLELIPYVLVALLTCGGRLGVRRSGREAA